VDDRQLHTFLEVSTRFNDWIATRIQEYGFIEEKDFYSFYSTSTGGRPAKGYALTLDMAKDVCLVLGISKYRDAVSRLDEDERGSVKLDTLGGPQEVSAINKPGIYTLILRSNKPEAKKFKC